jgi:flagellar hook-basal body complex protein FliE
MQPGMSGIESGMSLMQPGMNLLSAANPAGGAAISSLASSAAGFAPGGAVNASAPAPFADLLTDAVGQVNQLETQAHNTVVGLMTGTGVDVHQAMIATEKSSMAFEMALSVRNKAVQAYQQVIGMQF